MEKFNQLCVWPGTIVGGRVDEFEKFMLKEFDVRIKYAEEITTNPTLDDFGDPIPETGGRNDVFFYVHDDDIGKFAVPRLMVGIRWWEDAIKYNDPRGIYPEEVISKYPVTW